MKASDNYTSLAACPPPEALIEVYAGPGLKTRVCIPSELPQGLDPNTLYWRLTGIGREGLVWH